MGRPSRAGSDGDGDSDGPFGAAPGGPANAAAEGSFSAFFLGVALGVFLGAAALCWLCTGTTRRFKRGIVAGVSVNLFLTLSGVLDRPASASSGAGGDGIDGGGGGSGSGAGSSGGGSGSSFFPFSEPGALVPIGPHSAGAVGGGDGGVVVRRLLRGFTPGGPHLPAAGPGTG